MESPLHAARNISHMTDKSLTPSLTYDSDVNISHDCYPILVQCQISIPPENFRKPDVFRGYKNVTWD